VIIRNMTFIGVLGVGIAVGGCNNAAPPAASPTPQPAAPTSIAPPASTAPVSSQTAPPVQQAAAPAATAPPTATYAETATAPPPEIIVETPPPPPRTEQIVIRPGYVWNPGYWRWDDRGRHHEWIAGSYIPERPGFAWEPGRWSPGPDHRWHFRGGYWAQRAPGPILPPHVVPLPHAFPPPHAMPPPHVTPPNGGISANPPPPPSPRIEPIVQRPGYVWTPGYWRWVGNRYVWVGGASVRAREGWVWIPHRWVEGPHGERHLEEGHWQHR
jgi:hypothetical protein